jgi:L-lactate permease
VPLPGQQPFVTNVANAAQYGTGYEVAEQVSPYAVVTVTVTLSCAAWYQELAATCTVADPTATHTYQSNSVSPHPVEQIELLP